MVIMTCYACDMEHVVNSLTALHVNDTAHAMHMDLRLHAIVATSNSTVHVGVGKLLKGIWWHKYAQPPSVRTKMSSVSIYK